MAEKLSSLLVDLQVNSAALRAGLEKAVGHLGEFAKTASKIGNAIGAALAADVTKDAVVKLGEFVMKGAEVADNMGKLAASVGVPVEAMSRLAYAADLSGVSTEQLGAGLGKLSKKMAEAAGGGQRQTAIFDALGVKVRDANGKLRDGEAVMGDLAEAFSGMEDGSAKAALAQELFGESGAKMIPLLNLGRDGLAELAAEADRFGLTVTSSGAAGAEIFNDTITRLQKAGEGLAIRVAQDLAPSIAKLGEELLSTKDGASALDGASKVLATTMRVLVSAGAVVAGLFQVIGQNIAMTAAAAVYAAQGEFGKAWDVIKAGHGDMLGTIQDVATRVEAIWTKENPGKAISDSVETGTKRAEAALTKFQRSAGTAAGKAAKLFGAQQFATEGRTDHNRDPNAEEAARVEKVLAPWEQSFEAATKTAAELHKARLDELESLRKLGMSQDAYVHHLKVAMDEFAALRRGGEWRGVVQMASDKLQGGLGSLGGLISAGQQGAAAGMAAGPKGAAVGAAVGVGLELLMQSEGFAKAIEASNAVIKALADALGSFMEPMAPLIATFKLIVSGIGKMLKPSLDLFGNVISSLTPTLFVIGTVFEQIAPMFGLLLQGLVMLASNGVLLLLPVAFSALFEVIKWTGIGLLKVVEAISDWWNKAVDGIAWFIEQIANFEFKIGEAVFRPFAGLNGYAQSIRDTTVDQQKLAETIAMLEDLTLEEAEAKAAAILATEEQTKAVKDATAAFSNVPQGYKLALARFNAANGMASVGGGTSGGFSGEGGNIVVQMTVVTNDPRKLAVEFNRITREQNLRRNGSPVAHRGVMAFGGT